MAISESVRKINAQPLELIWVDHKEWEGSARKEADWLRRIPKFPYPYINQGLEPGLPQDFIRLKSIFIRGRAGGVLTFEFRRVSNLGINDLAVRFRAARCQVEETFIFSLDGATSFEEFGPGTCFGEFGFKRNNRSDRYLRQIRENPKNRQKLPSSFAEKLIGQVIFSAISDSYCVEILMKQTLKSRLFTVLAISSVTFGGPLTASSQDGFGFIRPVQPVRNTDDQNWDVPPIVLPKPIRTVSRIDEPELGMPPIVSGKSALPPISTPDSVSWLPSQSNSDNTPLAFAPSTISQADYDQSSNEPPIDTKPVGYNGELQEGTMLPPIVAGAPSDAYETPELDSSFPPIVSSASSEPMEVSMDVPPVLTPESMGAPELGMRPLSSLQPMALQSPMSLPPEFSNADTNFATEVPAIDDVTADEGPAVLGAGYSSAGVPLYANAPMPMAEPPIVSMEPPLAMNYPSVFGHQEPNPALGEIPMDLGTQQLAPPQPVPVLNAPPMQSVDPAYLPSAGMDSFPMNQQPIGEYFPNSGSSMGDSFFSQTPSEAPVIHSSGSDCASCNGVSGSCSTCNTGAVSGCQSCGQGGCYDPNSVSSQFNSCGSCAGARRYFMAEALYFDRYDGDISNSNFGSLGNFDWNAGWRFTLGRRTDSTRGTELSYMGTLPMDQTLTRSSAGGIINARFLPFDGFSAAQTGSFFDATQQEESKQTSFHSLEFNRVKWGWDVLKTYVGLRYIHVDDSYTMFSQNLTGDRGVFQLETMNHLIGPHIGAELFYDIGYRLSFSLVSKAGVYANFNETDTTLVNNGVQHLNNQSTGGTLSTSYELGLIGHYRLNRQARFRFGYNFLFLGEVASVSDNFPTVLTPATVSNSSDSDDMLFHGLSFGFEVYR